MSLAEYTPITETISIGRKQSITVRALGLDDVAVLIKDHLSDLDNLFDLYEQSAEQSLASARFIIALTREAPALVGTAIALACDEPHAVDNARRLSIPTQVSALKAILKLTFEEAGGVKNFVESLTEMLKTLAPAAKATDSPT